MTREQALSGVVLTHLAINIVHGRAHAGAQVALPPAGLAFVVIVILAAPLAGLALSFWRPRPGAWIVAASMGGALVFGLINHFIVAGTDHVANMAGMANAVRRDRRALVATEAAGMAINMWCAMPRVSPGRAR